MENSEKNSESLKALVREKYSEIVTASDCQGGTCCGMESCAEDEDYSHFSEDYSKLPGYTASADLKLGCGIPTEHAGIKAGHTVVDLGAGAGNDVFVAQQLVGETGRVIGIDMTEAMVVQAKKNAEALKVSNVEFRLGDIESIPLKDMTADVVVSNCVMNLVPDKAKAFSETYRILKPGGHFSISDIVLRENLPDAIRNAATMYAGCVSGALLQEDYLRVIHESGFTNVHVQTEKPIRLSKELLDKYLTAEEISWYRSHEPVIVSITVFGEKPK